ncbi:RNA-directed DNA polymerase, eukaryota, reverse transcriptase zinc-binding domain protein [Tanacetum coccineum]
MPRICETLTSNMERLVNNICTVWIGHHRIHANVARVKESSNSYAHVVKGRPPVNGEVDSNHALVLDESCLNVQDYSCCLMGKVKDLGSLSNLKVVLGSKGFDNIVIRYLGGYWVMIEFLSEEVKKTFQSNVGIGTWFSQLQQAFIDFNIDGRVTWVELKGIPLKLWSENTFKRIVSKWGALLHVDDPEEEYFYRKKVCITTTESSNIFKSFKLIYQGKAYWVRDKEVPGWVPNFVEQSDEENESDDENLEGELNGDILRSDEDLEGDNEMNVVPDTVFEEELAKSNGGEAFVGQNEMQSEDPFDIYTLLNKKKEDNNKVTSTNNSLKYPLGFTPREDVVTNVGQSKQRNECVREIGEEVNVSVDMKSGSKKSFSKEDGLEEVPLGGCSFMWCHKTAAKMSKLDRFLISESLINYGPIPFRFFHYWLEVDGFKKLVKDTWSEAPVDTSNAMLNLMKKLKYLKKKIHAWNKDMRKIFKNIKLMLKAELSELDSIIYKGDGNGDIINKRMAVVKSIQEVDKLQSMEAAQKAKIKWAIEGDENSKYYHGILNKKKKSTLHSRQILDGLFILNELFQWCKSKKKHSFIFKVDFEKAYDSVRWDYLDDILKKFDFGDRWCRWIQDCLRSSWGSVIVNGSPTEEFQFFKGLKQGDLLSPFIFILIMESLHILFQRVVDTDSSMQLSHMFYVDDAVFVRQWSDSNIDTIVHVLDCFYRASGLRINMSKSKLVGISVDEDRVEQAALKIGCAILKAPFSYLGGRLTLLKLVLGSMPIYNMSIFKVPIKVLQRMESIRCHFFNGADLGSKKSIWVKWNNVLASKEKGGLGVSSLYALNRALMFKWIWRFITQKTSLWARVIKAIHGDDGKIGKNTKSGHVSIWREIVQEMEVFKKQGTDIYSFIHKKLGNGSNTIFWEDVWRENVAFKYRYPRLYALESCKRIDVAAKLGHSSMVYSFRRVPRSGAEQS